MIENYKDLDFGYGKKTKKKKIPKKRLVAILICLIGIAGFTCEQAGIFKNTKDVLVYPKVEDSRTKEQARKDFDAKLQNIFMEEVTDDGLTLNYTLKNPANYGIKENAPTLGNVSLEDLKSSLMVSENRVAALETFDYKKLTEEQKLIYEIIYQMSKKNLESADFLEYTEVLGPTSGIQAQLPVFFAEYHFYSKNDVTNYLSLLKQVPDYFKQIISFEKQKSDKGLFMSDVTAQAIIAQCEEFVKNPEKNYLINIFAGKLAQVPGLTQEEKTAFAAQNSDIVKNSVIPAYQTLIEGLTKLKGTGKNDAGLSYFEKGKQYYEYMVQSGTGSDRSVKEMDKWLDEKIRDYKKEMYALLEKNPSAYYTAQSAKYKYDTPQKAMEYLKKCTEKDFPKLDDGITWQIKTVDPSLQDSMSPAFYLTPAIDDYKDNVIYVNESKKYDLSKAFTTIAHEGYPGHLYQNCYFRSGNPSPVRCVIHVGGYTEGWGVYSEIYGYDKAGLDKDTTKLLKINTLLTLCVYAKTDIGINYKGWSYKKTVEYLDTYGFSKKNAKTIFDSMVAEPGDYMQYTIGYLEIERLEQKAKKELGGRFDRKKFYDFFLSIGPAPFSIIEEHMEQWMTEQNAK